MDQFKKIEWVWAHRHSPYSLFAFPALGLSIGLAVTQLAPTRGALGIDAALTLAGVFVWWKSSRLPRAANDRIGLIVAIEADSSGDERKFRDKFVRELRQTAMKSTGRVIQVIQVPDARAFATNDEDQAIRLLDETRGLFLLFGRCSLGNVDGKRNYRIHLAGVVRHTDTTWLNRLKLQAEFTELLSPSLLIPDADDITLLDFHSGVVDVVANYVLGVAAFLSGDMKLAAFLYDACTTLGTQVKNDPAVQLILKRLQDRTFEVRYYTASAAYVRWLHEVEGATLPEFIELMKLVPNPNRMYFQFLLTRALYHFLKDRNIKAAMDDVQLCRKSGDLAWLYSKAFLLAYSGNFIDAERTYIEAFKTKITPTLLSQVERFMLRLRSIEPESGQVDFCLGIINWKVKADLRVAQSYFHSFVERGEQINKPQGLAMVKKYLIKIDRELAAAPADPVPQG